MVRTEAHPKYIRISIIPLLPYLFFGLLGWSLLAPLSSDYLPDAADLPIHVSAVVEATKAMKDGQFPIRSTPSQINGWGYLHFQFYSPFPYTTAAIVTNILNCHTPRHAYTGLKITLWLSLFLAGIFCFKISQLICESPAIGLLAGFAYMSAPWFLVNMFARGDFTESFAQGIVPVVLYYTFKNYTEPQNIRLFLCNVLAWFVLITSHNITFIYTSLFIGLFFFILTLQRYSSWKKLIYIGFPYLSGCILAAWFLAPVILLSKTLYIHRELVDPYLKSWLTPLANLLSVSAISPMPLPGNKLLPSFLYPQVGWPVLMSAGTAFYFLVTKKFSVNSQNEIKIARTAFILFCIAFFMVWTPVNFYHYLPKLLSVTQFGCRILTQTMWLGVLLFSLSFLWMFGKNLSAKYVVVGLFILGLCASSWLPTLKSYALPLDDVITSPSLGYSKGCFLVEPKKVGTQLLNILTKNLIPVAQAQKFCTKDGFKTNCTIENNSSREMWVQLPLFYYSKLLDIRLNGQKVNYYATIFKEGTLIPHLDGNDIVMATIPLQHGTNHIEFYVRGMVWANWISFVAWIIFLGFVSYLGIRNLLLKPFFKRPVLAS